MPTRVVIDPGSHDVLNLGDIAMLQVAVDRVGGLWPDAEVAVLTSDPDRLARHVPGTCPLPAAGRAVRAAAAAHGSEVVPLAGSNGQPVETVGDAVARAGGCRVVVAGSYHAAVFAVAQGVPAVCLARSPYYAAKMQGLRDAFGEGVTVVPIGGRLFEERAAAAIDAAWHGPDATRAALVAEAERQIACGRAAYARLAEVAAAAPVG